MTVRDILEGRANIAWGMVWGGPPLPCNIRCIENIYSETKKGSKRLEHICSMYYITYSSSWYISSSPLQDVMGTQRCISRGREIVITAPGFMFLPFPVLVMTKGHCHLSYPKVSHEKLDHLNVGNKRCC